MIHPSAIFIICKERGTQSLQAENHKSNNQAFYLYNLSK